MTWKKLGLIYGPDGDKPWSVSHAANPTAEHVDGDLYRVYFSTRDAENRSSIGYVELDINNPFEILDVARDPVLSPGELGMFDDCGVSIGCIVNVDGRRFLYYMGWNLAVTVPWKNAIGLAVSDGPGEPFERYSRFPIVPLDETDPYTISYPWVIRANDRFRMWYGSNLQWGPEKSDMRHVIKYAESDDGIHWDRDGTIAIGLASAAEYAICRPSVLADEGGYRMWFCHRGDAYRIGYAESAHGIDWMRADDAANIDVSPAGWDSSMIEYPYVFTHEGRAFMLYCGNDFGREGFGMAVSVSETTAGER